MRIRLYVLALCVLNILILAYHVARRGADNQQTIRNGKSIKKSITKVQTELERARSAGQLLSDALSDFRVPDAACDRVLSGESTEIERLLRLPNSPPPNFRPDRDFAADNCDKVRHAFVTRTLSQDELSMPIAFSLVVFKDFYQVSRLFRSVYRPEHYYCFHIDAKADKQFVSAVNLYASCFHNVAVADKKVDIRWGTFSVLEAELICMRKLLSMSGAWKYFINLTGQEFPIRTMLELVRALKDLNGANNMENAGTHKGTKPLSVKLSNGAMLPIKWYKGSVHITATRQFVEFALSDIGNQVSAHLRQHGSWPCPDETFFATLNFNAELRAPGGDPTGIRTDNKRHPFFNRYKNWLFGVFGYPCLSGKTVRQICIWGLRDLRDMNSRPELFANKFYYDFQPHALRCFAERLLNNSLADYGWHGNAKTHTMPAGYYANFDFVRQHL